MNHLNAQNNHTIRLVSGISHLQVASFPNSLLNSLNKLKIKKENLLIEKQIQSLLDKWFYSS